MSQAMGSQKMFRVGLVLGILGAISYLFASPVIAWVFTDSGFPNPVLGIVGGLAAVIQQGTFLGGLFLLVGSFVVRAVEEAVAGLRSGKPQNDATARD